MKKYSLICIAYVFVFVIGTWLTYRDNRPSDGQLSFGFPLSFYHGGGYCGMPCGPNFYLSLLILDVLFLILPIIAFYWYQKRKNIHH